MPPIPTRERTRRSDPSPSPGSLNNMFTNLFLSSSLPFTSVVSIIEIVIGLSICWVSFVGTN
uniref:Uncharacterized protein MANES_04G135600 n=1 Tax=Rhizophora mucronata TaxID=61149 RepID=A0A2P2MJJ8_RHIMU